ncbi:MAG: hypothetical protein ACTS45_01785 [Candidatus Hodgkinia cicadicola]
MRKGVLPNYNGGCVMVCNAKGVWGFLELLFKRVALRCGRGRPPRA